MSMATNERSPEDDYFAREDIEKQHKLAKELGAKRSQEQAETLRKAHWMKCPKCGNDLQTIKFKNDVDLDRCFHCHGTWLDAGELEKIAAHEEPHRIVDAIVNIFKRT